MSGRLVCWKCHQPISPGQQFLNAVGHTWHEQCFSCRNCSRSLGTGEFYTVNSEPFCAQCHVTQDVPNCAKCHQPVHRGVDFLKYEGQSYHARCFTCEGCSRELSTADFFKVDGRRYCSPCSDNMTSQTNSYSGGYSSNPPSYGNSNSSPSSNRNSSPYSNSGASSYGSGSGASSYGSASSPSSYGNNSSSSSYAAAKPVSTYGGYNDNPTSSYGSNKPTSTYGSSSSSYAAAKPVSSYDSFNDDHHNHNHNDDDNNIDYSAEISIGVVPTSDTMTASHHATHHDHDGYNDHHNDHHHGHDNHHHHHNGEENGNEDQSDLNALVRELESSGSDFNSKYGGSGYQAGGNAGGGDESDPLAAALRSLQEFDDH